MTPSPSTLSRFDGDLAGLLPEGGRVGLAVSGGADSLAMLLLAAGARPGQVEAATVDHGLRPESRGECAQVERISAEIGVPHTSLRVTVGEGASLQAMARDSRYKALAGWAAARGMTAVLTAHHADDQAETLLMRLARGAGLGGLAGIQRRRPIMPGSRILLLRPLLDWRRQELAELVHAAGLTPVDDPSNADERFDRTRARQLLGETSWLDAARLSASASNLADAEEAMEWLVNREMDARSSSQGSLVTIVVDGLPREIRRRLLLRGVAHFGGEPPRGDRAAAALDILDAGGRTTLAGLLLEGGRVWRLRPAPPRR